MPIIVWLVAYPCLIYFYGISPWILAPICGLIDVFTKLLLSTNMRIMILQGQGHVFQWAATVIVMHLLIVWTFYWAIYLLK